DPKAIWPGFSAVINHPGTKNKRAAFRDSLDKAARQEFGDLMDPRNFFGSGGSAFWDELQVLVRAMRGDLGEETKDKVSKAISVYDVQSKADSIKWYRMTEVLSGPDPKAPVSIYLVYIWSSESGFNCVEMNTARDIAGTEPVRKARWSWR